jgi:hypothetical protein
MAQQLEVFDLALDAALHVAADEVLARDDLEGDLLAGAAMHGQLDLAEAALAERLHDAVGADALLGAGLFGAERERGVLPVEGRGSRRRHDGGVDGRARGRRRLLAGMVLAGMVLAMSAVLLMARVVVVVRLLPVVAWRPVAPDLGWG